MSNDDNIEILEVPHREYSPDRDWLAPSSDLQRRSAQVVTFTPGLLQCSICSSRQHRASACPRRPRQGRSHCAND